MTGWSLIPAALCLCVQRVLEETGEHYHVIQKFAILGDLDGNNPPPPVLISSLETHTLTERKYIILNLKHESQPLFVSLRSVGGVF